MSMSSKVLEDLFSSDSQAITEPFAPYQSIGEEETHAAIEVLKSGCLSGFLGSAGSGFLGGKNVQEFEKACCEYFHVSHAIVVNSWTSGLIASLGGDWIRAWRRSNRNAMDDVCNCYRHSSLERHSNICRYRGFYLLSRS